MSVLYWKIYPPRPEMLDEVATVVADALVRPEESELTRWFFIRFVDARGPHLRVRFRASEELLDRLEIRRPNVTRRLDQMPVRHVRPVIIGAPFDVWKNVTTHGVLSILGDVYEPETAKWGEGVELQEAERVFEQSSKFAVAFLAEEQDDSKVRLAVALQLALDMADSFDSENAPALLATHARWWSDAIPRTQVEAFQKATHLLGTALRRIEPAHTTVTRVARTSLLASTSALRDRPSRKPHAYLFHHHLHLTMNRLGVYPPFEAAVATVAALTMKETNT